MLQITQDGQPGKNNNSYKKEFLLMQLATISCFNSGKLNVYLMQADSFQRKKKKHKHPIGVKLQLRLYLKTKTKNDCIKLNNFQKTILL